MSKNEGRTLLEVFQVHHHSVGRLPTSTLIILHRVSSTPKLVSSLLETRKSTEWSISTHVTIEPWNLR